MKKLIARLQKDISKLQKTVHKEGNDLLKKIKQLDLSNNVGFTKKELLHAIGTRIKKFEPTYNTLVAEIKKNAKKAGIELDKIEKNLKSKAKKAKKEFSAFTKKKGMKSKSGNKSGSKKRTGKKPAEHVTK